MSKNNNNYKYVCPRCRKIINYTINTELHWCPGCGTRMVKVIRRDGKEYFEKNMHFYEI